MTSYYILSKKATNSLSSYLSETSYLLNKNNSIDEVTYKINNSYLTFGAGTDDNFQQESVYAYKLITYAYYPKTTITVNADFGDDGQCPTTNFSVSADKEYNGTTNSYFETSENTISFTPISTGTYLLHVTASCNKNVYNIMCMTLIQPSDAGSDEGSEE